MYLILVFLALFSGLCMGLTLIFYLRSERMNDKLIKTEDILFSLANKKGLFSKKNSLMRIDEAELFHLLEEAVGESYYVFPQVHFSELIGVANVNKDHEDLYLKLGEKHVDFAVFDKNRISPVAVIELNGEYHFRTSQKNKDEERKTLFESVGLGFITIPKATSYSLENIRNQILPYLST